MNILNCPTISLSYSLAVTPEEVRHGDITTGVKRVWNVITADKYQLFSVLKTLYFQFSLKPCTGAVSCGCSQSAKFKLKYKSKQRTRLHSLSEGPTRGHGVCLTCWSIHFRSSEYQNNSTLYQLYNRSPILLWQFVLKENGTSRFT